MTLTRRRFNSCLVAALAATALPPWTLARAEALKEGRDWRAVSPPQPSAAPETIEVLEFFSYGCPHCGQFNPIVEDWADSLPPDVAFRRVPVTYGRRTWENLARFYFALDQTGQLERLDQAFFDALHEDRRRLFSEDAILEWAGEQGADREELAAAFDSFGVHTQLARAEELAKAYGIRSVPALAVGGRYVVVGEEAKTYDDLLEIAEGLIAKVRSDSTSG